MLRERIPEEADNNLKEWPELVRRLLFYRGIETKKEAEEFLNPDYEKSLHDPFSILNMGRAVERILKAIKDNELIIVFGDYDADGVCASAIFYEFFKKIGFENFHFHIPDRHVEGYGLTETAIDEFIGLKAGLIITLDCGITDYEEVERVNSAKIDVVIIDHHLPPEKLPNAFAIVDSKQKDDKYPFKYLCGAGVAFKAVQALIEKGNFNITKGWEKWLLDLVALATIADMVPLTGENRVLVHYGLQVFRKTRRTGLLAFLKRMNFNLSDISEDDIAFMIAPRINIASRMGHANTSFELIITESPGEANWIAGHLEGLNSERKSIVEGILNDIGDRLEKAGLPAQAGKPEIIVEGDSNWNTGVLGLLCNRLMEKYQCPVFLWGRGGAKNIKGSCRSDGSINLVELMKSMPGDIFIESGGHALAAGFSIKDGKIGDFKKGVSEAFKKMPKEEVENGILYIDEEMKIDEVEWRVYGAIEKFAPFGVDNQKPVFAFYGLEIGNAKYFGNDGVHLQLDFKKSGDEAVSAVGFFMGNGDRLNLKDGQKIDLAASLEKSTFRGRHELRLRIVDIKIK